MGDKELRNNNRERQTLTVYVRSKSVPVSSTELKDYVQWVTAPVKVPRRVIQYEDRLDDRQKKILDFADDLAATLALPLKVVDVSKLNVFQRLARWISGRNNEAPALIISEGAFFRLIKSSNSLVRDTGSSPELATPQEDRPGLVVTS